MGKEFNIPWALKSIDQDLVIISFKKLQNFHEISKLTYFIRLKKIPMVGSLIYHGQKFLLGYLNIVNSKYTSADIPLVGGVDIPWVRSSIFHGH
jgi:hypothetical protein